MSWTAQSRRRFCGFLAATIVAAASLLGGCSEQDSTAAAGAAESAVYDVVIRGGTVYDGLGGEPFPADVAIEGDRLAVIGDLSDARGRTEVDASGLAVAPGFINMLSWAVESLIEDGRAQSDIRQGVTLEVFGEGESWGPWNESLKQVMKENQGDIQYDIEWTTLGEYLEFLENKGVSVNVASFIGATTVRENVIGFEDRVPTQAELEEMQLLVRQAMEEGALGVGSSLIYAPAFYAKTPELIALARTAAEYDGMYISHMRSEGNQLLEAVDELLEIAREADIRAEIYHLKAAGRDNWDKLDQVFEKVEAARAAGLAITADIYPYTAGATGLDAAMPPWVQEGGTQQWIERLKDPEIRQRVIEEMKTPSDDWENLYLAAGADKLIVVGFKNPGLKHLTGKTLAQVAEERRTSPEETAIDLVIEDGSRVGTVYFLMSEENIARKVQRDWVSVGSDADARAPEGVFLKSNPHPRAYGTFARFLGKYARDEQLISLPEAIRRLTSLPAENLRLAGRGSLQAGNFADVVVFDPEAIQDHATYESPHAYSTGVLHVFVNGEQVLKDGQHTGAMPGRVVRGPGWSGRANAHQRVVDLTHAFSADTIYWPTDTRGFQLETLASGRTEGGYFYSANAFCTAEHGGTHMDAPIHFSEDGVPVDEVPLSDLIGPGVVVDASSEAADNPDFRLTREVVEAHESSHGRIPDGAIVLLRTGWSERWPDVRAYLGDDTPGDASKLSFPGFGEEAARFLVEERGVKVLGVDTASIDYGRSTDFEVHRVAAERQVSGLENLTNLDALPAAGFTVIALPMKIAGGSGGPVRVVAMIADD